MSQQLVIRHPSVIRAGDRLNLTGTPVSINEVQRDERGWWISYTYEAARYTDGTFFVSHDPRHALPVRRYEAA